MHEVNWLAAANDMIFASGLGACTLGGELHHDVVARNHLEFSIGNNGDDNFVHIFVTRRCRQF